jgi:hypothetical protein
MTQKLRNALWLCAVIAVIVPCSAKASLWQRWWGVSEEQQNGQGTPVGAISQDTDFITDVPSPQGQALDFDLTASTLGLGSDFVVLDDDEREGTPKEGSAAFYCSKEKFSQIMKEAREGKNPLFYEDEFIPNEPTPFKVIEKKEGLGGALIFSTPLQYDAYLEFLKRAPSAKKAYALESYYFPQDVLNDIEVCMSASCLPVQERLNHLYTQKEIQNRYQILLPLMTEENLETVMFYPFVNASFFYKAIEKMNKGDLGIDFDHEGMGILQHEALRTLGLDAGRVFKWAITLRGSQQGPQLLETPQILDAGITTDQTEGSLPSVRQQCVIMTDPSPLMREEPVALPPTHVPVQQAILAPPGNGLVVPCVLGFGALVIGSLFLSHHK